MADTSKRERIWELAARLFVQLQVKEFNHAVKSSQLVKLSYDLAEEFCTQREFDLEKIRNIKE